MKKTREKIIQLIRENLNITIRELAEKTNLSIKGIEWNIKKMKEEDILKRFGPDKRGYWIIKKKIKEK